MTREQTLELIDKSAFKRCRDALAAELRTTFVFESLKVADAKPGCCKLGGNPDLPEGADWPTTEDQRPLSFLAQFDLGACESGADDWPFPAGGLLSFFYDADAQPWGNDVSEYGTWRALYTKASAKALTRAAFPTSLSSDFRFAEIVLRPHAATSLPSLTTIESDLKSPLAPIARSAPQQYDALRKALLSIPGGPADLPQLGGWPREEQGSMPQTLKSLVAPPNSLGPRQIPNPFAPGKMMTIKGPQPQAVPPTLRAWLEGTRDWTLLLQLPSDEDNAGWMWGDVGRLYFWASRTQARAGRFEHTWLFLQCG